MMVVDALLMGRTVEGDEAGAEFGWIVDERSRRWR
jgi:hypothetical protein